MLAAGRGSAATVYRRQAPRDRRARERRANRERLSRRSSASARGTLLSSQTDPKRGIGAALEWSRGEFQRYSAACGNCLTIVDPSETFTNDRIPKPTRVRDMVAIQRGTERPNDVVIITGHIDSRVSDPLNATSDAPGANDDGSGIGGGARGGARPVEAQVPGDDRLFA